MSMISMASPRGKGECHPSCQRHIDGCSACTLRGLGSTGDCHGVRGPGHLKGFLNPVEQPVSASSALFSPSRKRQVKTGVSLARTRGRPLREGRPFSINKSGLLPGFLPRRKPRRSQKLRPALSFTVGRRFSSCLVGWSKHHPRLAVLSAVG